jgi:hypothetical protein
MDAAGFKTRARLFVELVAGAVAYLPSALLIARATSRDFLNLLRNARRRRAPAPPPAAAPEMRETVDS